MVANDTGLPNWSFSWAFNTVLMVAYADDGRYRVVEVPRGPPPPPPPPSGHGHAGRTTPWPLDSVNVPKATLALDWPPVIPRRERRISESPKELHGDRNLAVAGSALEDDSVITLEIINSHRHPTVRG